MERPQEEAVCRIIDQKVKAEKIKITESAVQLLYKVANESTLRFAFGLLPLAAVLSEEISVDAVQEVARMFNQPN